MIRLTDLSQYLVRPEETISAVVARINALPYLFLVVVDGEGRLVGTITDGDIRRGILKGITLETAAAVCMQQSPKFGQVGRDSENAQILGLVPAREQFLPVLDGSRKVCEILVQSPDEALRTAIVMAGGPGTRLGERTRAVPKPLLEVGGRPILDRVLEGLERAGVRRIILAVYYLAEQVERFTAARRNAAIIEFVREPSRLGTAGALGLIDPSSVGSAPLLIVNGDLVTRVDFRALHDFHVRHDNDGTVAVANYRVEVPFGVVRHDEEGLFEGVDEKPQLNHFVAAGVYYLSPQFLALLPKGKPFDMPELLNQGKAIGLRVGLFPIHEEWADIGRPADMDAVDAAYKRSGL
jgi:dTDP-glucose pyrophosphorylase